MKSSNTLTEEEKEGLVRDRKEKIVGQNAKILTMDVDLTSVKTLLSNLILIDWLDFEEQLSESGWISYGVMTAYFDSNSMDRNLNDKNQTFMNFLSDVSNFKGEPFRAIVLKVGNGLTLNGITNPMTVQEGDVVALNNKPRQHGTFNLNGKAFPIINEGNITAVLYNVNDK